MSTIVCDMCYNAQDHIWAGSGISPPSPATHHVINGNAGNPEYFCTEHYRNTSYHADAFARTVHITPQVVKCDPWENASDRYCPPSTEGN